MKLIYRYYLLHILESDDASYVENETHEMSRGSDSGDDKEMIDKVDKDPAYTITQLGVSAYLQVCRVLHNSKINLI